MADVRARPRTTPRNAYYVTRRPAVAYSSGTQRGLYGKAARGMPYAGRGRDGTQRGYPAGNGGWRDIVLLPLLADAYEFWNREV